MFLDMNEIKYVRLNKFMTVKSWHNTFGPLIESQSWPLTFLTQGLCGFPAPSYLFPCTLKIIIKKRKSERPSKMEKTNHTVPISYRPEARRVNAIRHRWRRFSNPFFLYRPSQAPIYASPARLATKTVSLEALKPMHPSLGVWVASLNWASVDVDDGSEILSN